MSGWVAKRFWTEARTEPAPGGHAVLLDARPVRTPAKSPLIVPTRALGQAIADEWNAQEGKVDPTSMPLTRAANSAIDKVTPQREEVVGLIAAYGDDDLLCYRATGPEALVARQAAEWDPVLEWAARALGAPLRVTSGVMHVEQPGPSLAALSARVAALDPFGLTALHDLVGLSGSLVLGLAVIEGHLETDRAWELSRIDEEFQAERWGRDPVAADAAKARHRAFLQSYRFWQLVHTAD